MSTRHEQAAPEVHQEHAHPGPRTYVEIAVALAVLTTLEVILSYINVNDFARGLGIMICMTLKFALVVMWFMHLRFDNRLFTVMFVGGLTLAVAVFIAVLSIQRAIFA